MESEKVKEIKKALEDNKTDHLPYIDGWKCKFVEYADILALINELESENAKLKQHKRELQGGQQDLTKRIAELEKENAKYKRKLTTNQWVQEIRKEALKQFAEKLIEKKVKLGERFNIYDIDETLKEFIDG